MKVTTIAAATLLATTASAAKLQAYSSNNYKNIIGTYTTSGWHSLNKLASSYHYLSDWNEVCVLFCNDKTFMGYRCQDTDQPSTDFKFNKINIYVGARPSC